MTTELWAIALVLAANAIGSFGPIYLKKASVDFNFSLKTLFNKHLLAGLFFYGVGTILFVSALKGGEISVLYPLVATVYIWVSFLSLKMLDEKITLFKIVGILLIILGVCFIGFA